MDNNDISLLKEICKSIKYLDDKVGDMGDDMSKNSYVALTRAVYLLGKYDPISLEKGGACYFLKSFEEEYITWNKYTIAKAMQDSKPESNPVHDSSGCRDCLHRNDMCKHKKSFPCLLHTKELSLPEMWEQRKKEMGIE